MVIYLLYLLLYKSSYNLKMPMFYKLNCTKHEQCDTKTSQLELIN